MIGGPVIKVAGLEFSYPGGHQALKGIDLQVMPGERLAVFGPNGAGKTTFALHLNGIHMPVEGAVMIGGVVLNEQTVMEIRRRVGMVFQDPDDQLFMPTVRQDVAFGPANFGVTGEALDLRVIEALEAVGMAHAIDRAPHHLSLGERRRVAVATVLASEPEILVLDEPSSNLDPASRRELADILTDLDVTIVMVTHDLPYALELCERAVIISGGRVVADGDTPGILADEPLLRANRLELPYGFDPNSV